MNNLAQLEFYEPGCVLLISRNVIITIRQLYRYQTSGMVKDRLRSGQPRITTGRPDATLTAFFVLWHYPRCVKIKGEHTL